MQKKFASESAFVDLHILTALFVVAASAFLVLFATANSSGLGFDPATTGGPTPTPTPGSVLYDQYDNFSTEKTPNIPSQDAEPALNSFDSQAADDFIVPAGQTWQVTEVDVLGEYDTQDSGPAESFHVFFYENGAGDLPGTLVASRLENPYTGSNDFVITLTEPVTLTEGHYWVSVQARQDITQAGFWLWHNRTVQANSGAAWQNPGNGFGTGCRVWIRRVTCAVLQQTAPDQVFRLIGTVSGGTPTPTPTPEPITLSAAGRKVNGINTVRLTWSGATSTNVDVYRNGVVIVTTANDGSHTDSTGDTGRARYRYQVCEAGTQTCSNNTTVTFRR
jgi:hypothetical protein